MSTPIAVNDVIGVTYFNRLWGQVVETTLLARCTAAPTGSTAEAQLSDLVGRVAGPTFPFLQKYVAGVCVAMLFDYVRVQRVSTSRTIYFESPTTLVGARSDQALAPNLACSIEKQSLHVGRQGVGRVQLAGLALNDQVGGNFIPATTNPFVLPICTELISSWAGGALFGGTYKWCLPGAIPGAGGAYDVFNSFYRLQVRTMHRRTVGLGI